MNHVCMFHREESPSWIFLFVQEHGTWNIVESPPSDMNLRKVELVEIDVILSNSFPENEFHFELKQNNSGVYHLVENQVTI